MRGPVVSASFFEWAFINKRPNLYNGGLHLPYTMGGLYQFDPLRTFSDCEPVSLGDSPDCCLSDPEMVIMKLRANRGHAPAQQLKRVLVDSDGGNSHLLTCVDEVSEQCEGRRAFDRAPHSPIAGTSTVAMFNEKLRVDLLSLHDILAFHVMGVFSEYSLLIPVRTKNPQEVWGAFCNSRIGVFGPPQCIQMDEVGE